MAWSSEDKILVVHLGGLGDVCLSESTFSSLASHFGQSLTAAGYIRFLGLFSANYFSSVHSVESREWTYLFADGSEGQKWKRIILIGKDRSGSLRGRLSQFSLNDFLFIDMYPDSERVHVEDYQLAQLKALDITPVKRHPEPKQGHSLIFYPEKGYRKQKWPYERFLEVYNRLRNANLPLLLLEPFDTEAPHPDSFRFNELPEVRQFLARADVFVSNDCGIAHLAASCGLKTITLFFDADPVIWHPLGNNYSIRCNSTPPSVDELLALVRTVSGKP